MIQPKTFLAIIISAMMITACNSRPDKGQSDNARRLLEIAYKQRDYNRLLSLADSVEKNGGLSQAETYYWKGYASDRLKKSRMAEFYWKTALEASENSTAKEDLDIYAKTASRLANLLSVKGNYEGTLKIGEPAAIRLEEQQCDTTSDYVNLLIYIGCCQAATNKDNKDAEYDFERAYQKHKDNIDKNHTDAAYKNAIAGLINIAYFCNHSQNYQAALKWIGHFGELLNEYVQRPDTDPAYIDKQLARFDIYQALALEGLGKKEEAAKVYESFKSTKFSQTPEGRINGNEYLVAADRWDEAADNYHSLNAFLATQEGAMSLEDIQDMLLKKYTANIQAGRRDSAAAVSMQICDSLDNVLALTKKLDAEEQVTIVDNVELVTRQKAAAARQKQMWLFVALAILFLGFLLYAYYRRRAERQLMTEHEDLKKAFAQLEEKASSRERTATELRIAHSMNSTAKAAEASLPKGFSAYAQITPTDAFGSSICDYHTKDGKLFLCIGDVAGEGIESSMAAASLKAQFRTASELESNPQDIVKAVSTSRNWADPVTLFVGVIDLGSRTLSYYNAGHDAPLIMTDSISRIEDVSGEITMANGCMLFLFNNGVLTAKNKDNKQYGENKLLGAALQAMKSNPWPEPFVLSIEENISRFVSETVQEKDLVMLAIKS